MNKSRIHIIRENQDVLKYFMKVGINLSNDISERIHSISIKTNNNYVGYYQFFFEGTFHKFFVIPKIHNEKEAALDQTKFTKFLTQYYRLKEKYQERIKPKDIDSNFTDFSFLKLEDLPGSSIIDFIQAKYLDALITLDHFFRKHMKVREETISYSSQSIRHKLDLSNNIRNLDKSNVYQVKKQVVAYSQIAYIAAYALKQFKMEKVKHLEESATKEKLVQKANSILNTINKRFTMDSQFSFKDKDIIANKIAKLFKRNKELKKVYLAILILIGLEHFQSQDKSQEIRKIENMVAMFFNPADLYEWVVFDHLKGQHGEDATINTPKIGGTEKSYSVDSKLKSYIHLSKPDFVVVENHMVTIIDAKWKILEKQPDIKFEDIAKLKRDFDLRKLEHPDKEHRAVLIYPKIDFDFEEEHTFWHSYEPEFSFRVEMIDV